jgi:hypothetical protein
LGLGVPERGTVAHLLLVDGSDRPGLAEQAEERDGDGIGTGPGRLIGLEGRLLVATEVQRSSPVWIFDLRAG